MFGETNEMSLEITAYSGVGLAAFGDLLRGSGNYTTNDMLVDYKDR